MFNNNKDRYHYTCSNCGRYILKSCQFDHDIKCQSEKQMFEQINNTFNYKCKICGRIMDEFDRLQHILFHQSKKNELIHSNVANNNSSDLNSDQHNINNNSNNNLDLSTITLGRNNNNIIFRYQNNNDNNRRRNRRNSMDNNAINRIMGFNSSSSDSNSIDSFPDNHENNSSKDLDNNSNNQKYVISKIKDPKKLSENKKRCLICLEKFKKGEDSIILPCIHIFHSACIKKWMKIKNVCPLCKKEIKSK